MKTILFIIFALVFSSSFAKECDLENLKWTGIPFHKSGKFLKECKSQTLYSWIGDLKTINQKDILWPFRRKTAIFFIEHLCNLN